jgi:hypothetical protein
MQPRADTSNAKKSSNDQHSCGPLGAGLRGKQQGAASWRSIMDMRKFATGFIKPDDVRDGPLQDRIIGVFESEKFQRPVLELASGNQFTVNNTNCAILNKAWGWNSEDWLDQELEFTLGHYKDWREDKECETVVVRPISPRKASAPGAGIKPSADKGGAKAIPTPKPSVANDLNDDMPF